MKSRQSNDESEQFRLEQIASCGMESTPTNQVTIPPPADGIDAISPPRKPVLANATIKIAICADKPIKERDTFDGRTPYASRTSPIT